MKAFVTAWSYGDEESGGGGGFNWFFTAADADEAFEDEKKNCTGFDDENWTAYRFDVVVADGLSNDQVTREIDDNLIELCDKAATRFPAKETT